MVTEQKPCYACGKRAAINEGLCFGCLLEYAKHQADFANITTSTYPEIVQLKRTSGLRF